MAIDSSAAHSIRHETSPGVDETLELAKQKNVQCLREAKTLRSASQASSVAARIMKCQMQRCPCITYCWECDDAAHKKYASRSSRKADCCPNIYAAAHILTACDRTSCSRRTLICIYVITTSTRLNDAPTGYVHVHWQSRSQVCISIVVSLVLKESTINYEVSTTN